MGLVRVLESAWYAAVHFASRVPHLGIAVLPVKSFKTQGNRGNRLGKKVCINWRGSRNGSVARTANDMLTKQRDVSI